MTVIAVALLIGLGALGTGIGFAILGGKFLEGRRSSTRTRFTIANSHVHRGRSS